MGLLAKFSSLWGHPRAAAPVDAHAAPRAQRPVRVHALAPDPPRAAPRELAPRDAWPRSKAELVSDLRKNYAEVVELMRKLHVHLDAQQSRANRLMEILEQLPPALATLPAIAEHNRALVERTERLADEVRQSAAAGERSGARVVAAVESAHASHARTLDLLGTTIQRSADAEERTASSLDSVGTAIGSVADATGRLGAVVDGIRDRDDKRDVQITELIGRSSRWMTTAMVLCTACLALAVILAVTSV